MITNKITLLSMATMLFACTPDPKTVDDDGDGVTEEQGDCDDTNAAINPSATEICDEIDNNCNGNIDDNDENVDLTTGSTFYEDYDLDGFGDPEVTQDSCAAPEGFVADNTDCDDTDETVNPDAIEICDEGIDNDCDGTADMDDDSLDMETTTTFYEDLDADLYGDPEVSMDACDVPEGYIDNMDDCDDADPAVNPDAMEICDGIDNDCDELIDDNDDDVDLTTGIVWYEDFDEDSYGDPLVSMEACDMPEGYVDNMMDCDDTDNMSTSTDVDADCDSVLTADDCNDYDANSTTVATDADCDDVETALDCDDADDQIGSTDADNDTFIDCIDDCDPADPAVGATDNDQDGFLACIDDCDDDDAMTYPGAAANEPSLCTSDVDGDGYGPFQSETCLDLTLADSYGDGWNGNSFDFVVDGAVVYSVTLASGSSGTDTVCFNGDADLVWNSGSYTYEISMEVSMGGNVIQTIAGSDFSGVFSSGDVVTTFNASADPGSDCDDTDSASLLTTEDGDCDGTVTADDCDDADATSTIIATDADCDGVLTADDCNDGDPASVDDMDCDGVLTADDCDDSDSASTTLATDADCDGVLTADDCDDADSASTTLATDADCDGVLTADDCNDDDATTVDDMDCDGVLTADDCDDSDSTVPSADDMDCDGVLVADDCDDTDVSFGDISNDADCDGAITANDCDDTDVSFGDISNDADCDGAITANDCDDSDLSLNNDDLDADGYSTCDGDCDDADASANLDDADGDGYATCALDTCFTFDLADSWGDGWNGNSLDLWEDGVNVGSITIASGSSYSEEVCPTAGSLFEVQFVAGTWTSETSFTMTNSATGAVYTGQGSGISSGQTMTVTDASGSSVTYSSLDVIFSQNILGGMVDSDDNDPNVQ